MDQMFGGAAVIATMAEFSAYLEELQNRRANEVCCELTPVLSARLNDKALTEALITGLPMAQGIQHRIVRSRGRGAILTAKLRWREGVRMLSGEPLTAGEAAALEMAQAIIADIPESTEEERFRRIYEWVCGHIRYAHTAPGRKGYERLVGASGALQCGEANCQGFADVMYLLCGLAGISCEYRIGRGERRLHVWNAVRVNGEWREADASKGARRQRPQGGCWLL